MVMGVSYVQGLAASKDFWFWSIDLFDFHTQRRLFQQQKRRSKRKVITLLLAATTTLEEEQQLGGHHTRTEQRSTYSYIGLEKVRNLPASPLLIQISMDGGWITMRWWWFMGSEVWSGEDDGSMDSNCVRDWITRLIVAHSKITVSRGKRNRKHRSRLREDSVLWFNGQG